MIVRRASAALAALCLFLPRGARAQAAAPAPEPPPAPAPYWVDFEAGHVVLDPELMQLELSKKVTIRVDRYRLTSERLRLERTRRGVEIHGEGRVAFCPCEDAPVSFGFREAIVAPPTDLFVRNATLRVGDVPVFWTPVLWLRAPDRLGMLPPRLAWRGEDGLLAGGGVHVPLGGKRGPTLSALDLLGGGYFEGGIELESRVTTPTTSTRVRFDHLRQSLLAVDAHGSVASNEGAVGAFRVDALRGARGLRGTLELEPVARRFDHARAAVGAAGRGVSGSLGGLALAPRGSELNRAVAAGPLGELGFGATLGSGASADAYFEASTLGERGRSTTSLLWHHALLDATTHAGPLRLSARLDEHAVLEAREEDGSSSGFAGARVGTGLPLARAFGAGEDPWVHRLEPLIDAGARLGAHRGRPSALDAAPLGDLGLGAVGLDTALGRYGSREALELSLRAGGTSELDTDSIDPALAGALAIDTEHAGASLESVARPDSERALYAAGSVRVGRADGLHLETHAAGTTHAQPVLARELTSDHFAWPDRPYLDRPGWSLGSRAGVPWTKQIASAFAWEADLSQGTWLAWRSSLAYRHPCGCFAVLGRAGQRLGRGGFDADVTLDLMP